MLFCLHPIFEPSSRSLDFTLLKRGTQCLLQQCASERKSFFLIGKKLPINKWIYSQILHQKPSTNKNISCEASCSVTYLLTPEFTVLILSYQPLLFQKPKAGQRSVFLHCVWSFFVKQCNRMNCRCRIREVQQRQHFTVTLLQYKENHTFLFLKCSMVTTFYLKLKSQQYHSRNIIRIFRK